MNPNLMFAATIITIIIGILFNRQDAKSLDAKIDAKAESLRTEMRADRKELGDKIDKLRDGISGDLRDFFKTLTDLESRVHRQEEKK